MRLASVSLVLLASALSIRAEVLVVDEAGGPGSAFIDIQSAVDTALEGDTILVRDGSYPAFVIDGKSLSVVADGDDVTLSGGLFTVSRTVEVRNLIKDQAVMVCGFDADTGVAVVSCDGAVWFDDFSISGDVFCPFSARAFAGAYIEDSSKVTFTRCTLHGESEPDPQVFFSHTGDGLDALRATVQLFDCQVEGGWGEDAAAICFCDPQPGGAGIRIDESSVTIVGCSVRGGEGGLDLTALCTGTHAVGGPGAEFVNGTGTLQSVESTMVGGVASLEPLCPGLAGPPGPIISGSGTIEALPGVARHLEANSPVRAGETLTFDLEGLAGEVPVLFLSPTHAPVPVPDLSSVLLVGFPFEEVFVLAPLPTSGQTSFSFSVPSMAGIAESLTYYGQAAFFDSARVVWLGAGTTTVLLGASF